MNKVSDSIDTTRLLATLFPGKGNLRWTKEIVADIIDNFFAWHKVSAGVESYQNSDSIQSDTLVRAKSLLLKLSREFSEVSVPWASPNYNAHMNSDIPLISILGYFLGMLYNPNNVTDEVSPLSTCLEQDLSYDFCKMLGYDPKISWAHLSSGAHSSNYEAIWMARNLRSIPFALYQMPGIGSLLSDNDKAAINNLPTERILTILGHIKNPSTYAEILQTASKLRNKTVMENGRLLISENCHYSWGKCADILGITESNFEKISVDHNYRIDTNQLVKRITSLIEEKIPIIAVVLFLGSSGEGSVDDIQKIIEFRNQCVKKYAQSFYIHVDAAYGGFFRTAITNEESLVIPYEQLIGDKDECFIKPEVYDSLKSLGNVDSITFDPHKSGSLQYSAGGLAIKDRRISSIISSSSRYFDYNTPELNFGPYTLEGARAGAMATAAWCLYKIMPLNHNGMGKLLRSYMTTAQHFYNIAKTNNAFINNPCLRAELLHEPDLSIVNFIIYDAKEESSVSKINALNNCIMDSIKKTNYQQLTFSKNTLKGSSLADIYKQPELYDHQNKELTTFRSCFMKPISKKTLQNKWLDFLEVASYALKTDYIKI